MEQKRITSSVNALPNLRITLADTGGLRRVFLRGRTDVHTYLFFIWVIYLTLLNNATPRQAVDSTTDYALPLMEADLLADPLGRFEKFNANTSSSLLGPSTAVPLPKSTQLKNCHLTKQ